MVELTITRLPPPDYTHSWELCGELLEEMGNAISDGWEFSCEHSDMEGWLGSIKWRVWMTITDDPEEFQSIAVEADSFCRAVAECYYEWWLAWRK